MPLRKEKLSVPQELEEIFDNPGRQWSQRQRDRVHHWLIREPQWEYLLKETLLVGVFLYEEAEYELELWLRKSFAGVVDEYDPNRGGRFWSYQGASAKGYVLERVGKALYPFQVPHVYEELFMRPGRTWQKHERDDVQNWLHRPPQRPRMLARLRAHPAMWTARDDEVEGVLHLWFAVRYDAVTDRYEPAKGPYWIYSASSARGYLLTCLANRRYPDELRRLLANVRGGENALETRVEIDDDWEDPEKIQYEIPDPDLGANPEPAAMMKEFMSLLAEALQSLDNPNHRMAFEETRINGRSPDDVAADYGYRPNTISVWSKRAIEKLRKWFEVYHPEMANLANSL